MTSEKWIVIRDGISHQLSADFEVDVGCVELCPICGNACMGVVSVWYVNGQKRCRVRVDRPTWDTLFDILLQDAIERGQYANLPSFLRERNEMTGWCAFGVLDGGEISAEEVLNAISAIKKLEPQLQQQCDMVLEALRNLAANAIEGGYSFWACDD